MLKMNKAFLQAEDNGTKLDSHIMKICTTYFELQDMIQGLAEFDLSCVDAQQELRMLIGNFESNSLVKIMSDLLMMPDVAINRANTFKACAYKSVTSFAEDYSKDGTVNKDDKAPHSISKNAEVGCSNAVSESNAAKAKSYDSHLDATVLTRKVTDQLCLESLKVPIPDTDPSITAWNDGFLNSSDLCKSKYVLFHPPDHPALQDNAVEEVINIWNLGKGDVVFLPYQYKFSPELYSSLEPGQKVVGEIINGYNRLIVKRSGENGLPTVSAAPDYFLDFCLGASVMEMPTNDINFDADILLFPMHRYDHWYICSVDMRPLPKLVKCYDSLYSAYPDYEVKVKEELKYVADFIDNHIKSKGPPVQWKFLIMDNAPQQTNCVDCGVFTCKNADYLATDRIPAFDQSNIPYYRHQIVVELEAGKLSRII